MNIDFCYHALTGETKGRVWEGTTAKDEAMREWCERINEETGIRWRYIRIDQTEFDSKAPATLGELTSTYRDVLLVSDKNKS